MAIYATIFMYEDEQGKWQDRVEELWIAVDDRAKLVGSKAIALFNKVAQAITVTFDRVFGYHLLSLRSVGASTSCSSAVALTITLFWRTADHDALNGAFFLGVLVTVVCALVPILFRSPWLITFAYVPIAFTLLYLVTHRDWHNRGPLILLGTLMASFISDVSVVIAVRSVIRWVAHRVKIWQISIAMFFQLLIGLFVTIGFFAIATAMSGKSHKVADRSLAANIMLFSSLFNVFTAIICFVMSFTLVGVLLHRMFWPVFARVIYPVARYDIIRNKKFLGLTGSACLAYGFQIGSTLSKFILTFVAK